MHCHMESHNANGMALVIQEGNVSDMNRLPTGFKTCGNFDWSEEEFQSLRKEPSGRCHRRLTKRKHCDAKFVCIQPFCGLLQHLQRECVD